MNSSEKLTTASQNISAATWRAFWVEARRLRALLQVRRRQAKTQEADGQTASEQEHPADRDA